LTLFLELRRACDFSLMWIRRTRGQQPEAEKNIAPLLRQSFATAPSVSSTAATPLLTLHFVTDSCNMRDPMFTDLSAMMPNFSLLENGVLFRSADSLFKRQANETLIGDTCAGCPFAYSVVKLAGQTQVD
jgi:hypothetical protein